MFTCTFNRPLVAGVLDGANWTMDPPGPYRIGNVVTVAPGSRTVIGTTVAHPAGPAPNTIRYDPPPHDVLPAGGGIPAPGFTDYALTYL